jgi:hypothetical protein
VAAVDPLHFQFHFHFTSLHFTSLHFTSLHFTSLHFTSFISRILKVVFPKGITCGQQSPEVRHEEVKLPSLGADGDDGRDVLHTTGVPQLGISFSSCGWTDFG